MDFKEYVNQLKTKESEAKNTLNKKGFNVSKVCIKKNIAIIFHNNGLKASMSLKDFENVLNR